MNKHLLTIAGLASLLAAVPMHATTIINDGDKPATVTVFYKDVCKPNSALLKPGESLYVNQTCQRDRIESVGASGYSKIVPMTGDYNLDGEIITFEHNQ